MLFLKLQTVGSKLLAANHQRSNTRGTCHPWSTYLTCTSARATLWFCRESHEKITFDTPASHIARCRRTRPPISSCVPSTWHEICLIHTYCTPIILRQLFMNMWVYSLHQEKAHTTCWPKWSFDLLHFCLTFEGFEAAGSTISWTWHLDTSDGEMLFTRFTAPFTVTTSLVNKISLPKWMSVISMSIGLYSNFSGWFWIPTSVAPKSLQFMPTSIWYRPVMPTSIWYRPVSKFMSPENGHFFVQFRRSPPPWASIVHTFGFP